MRREPEVWEFQLTPKRESKDGPNPPKISKRKASRGRSRDEFAPIIALAQQVAELTKKARALGIFVEDRELLKCSRCGLMEDVLIGGLLVTYHQGRDPADTGLRFKESKADGRFTCPMCGTEIDAATFR
jgi:hypothetical protein